MANLVVGFDLTGQLTGRETTFARLAPSVESIGFLLLAASLLLLALLLLGLRTEALRVNPRLLAAYTAGLALCLAALTAAGVWCLVVSLTVSSKPADWKVRVLSLRRRNCNWAPNMLDGLPFSFGSLWMLGRRLRVRCQPLWLLQLRLQEQRCAPCRRPA